MPLPSYLQPIADLSGYFADAGVLAAEFTVGSKRVGPTLTLNRIANGRREFVQTFKVANKREARALAKAYGATPWNF